MHNLNPFSLVLHLEYSKMLLTTMKETEIHYKTEMNKPVDGRMITGVMACHAELQSLQSMWISTAIYYTEGTANKDVMEMLSTPDGCETFWDNTINVFSSMVEWFDRVTKGDDNTIKLYNDTSKVILECLRTTSFTDFVTKGRCVKMVSWDYEL